ncbi:hypothetical protein ATCC90586_003122 [Pythium insidiosum]|nr:hypothetical protein ATCC90586_003122 [Pythium insidiosum]
MDVDGDGARPSAARGQQQQPATTPARDPAAPQVERVLGLVGGGRYVLFSVAATAIAVASTYQKAPTIVDADGSVVSAWLAFREELLRSRLNMAIVLHFYFVVLYHVFLGVTHVCFDSIRRAELQVSILLTRPMTRPTEFHRLAFTLLAIIVVNGLVAAASTHSGGVFSTTVVHLTWFEAALFVVKAAQLGTKVVFHLFDVGHLADHGVDTGEYGLLVLQTGLSGTYLVLLVSYYLYIISVDHFRVSFMDFILILNVKNATVELLEKVKQVQMYHQVVVELDALFPDATQGELDAVQDDVCVICLKPMENQVKKLECGHLFHRVCLRQCLQRASIGDAFAPTTLDPIARMGQPLGETPTAATAQSAMSNFRCPLCRKPVRGATAKDSARSEDRFIGDAPTPAAPAQAGVNGVATPPGVAPAPVVAEPPAGPPPERVFRVSTGFLARWLPVPDVYFEVARPAPTPFVVTDEMVLRVWEVFPQFSVDVIRRDLASTRSPERTIERILNGRISADGTAAGEGNILDDVDVDLRWGLSALWDAVWNPLGAVREGGAPLAAASPVASPRQAPPAAPGQPSNEANEQDDE